MRCVRLSDSLLVWLSGARAQLIEGRERYLEQRGATWWPPDLQRLPRSTPGAVVRDWAGWAEAGAGVQAGEAGTEERISYTRGHAARTATTCHSWPPFRGHGILPTD